MKEIFYKTGGVQRRVVDAFYKTGGVQRRIVKGLVKQNGVYRTFYEPGEEFSFTLVPGVYNRNVGGEYYAGYAVAEHLWPGSPAFGSTYGYSNSDHQVMQYFYAVARGNRLSGVFRGNLEQYGFTTLMVGGLTYYLDARSIVYNASGNYSNVSAPGPSNFSYIESQRGKEISVVFSR